MLWNRNIVLGLVAAGLLVGCSNDSVKIVRHLEKTERSKCEKDLVLNDPVHIGDRYFALERRGKLVCVFDSSDKLTEAYQLVSQEKATHVFTSEGKDWTLGTKYTFGPYSQPKTK